MGVVFARGCGAISQHWRQKLALRVCDPYPFLYSLRPPVAATYPAPPVPVVTLTPTTPTRLRPRHDPVPQARRGPGRVGPGLVCWPLPPLVRIERGINSLVKADDSAWDDDTFSRAEGLIARLTEVVAQQRERR